MGQLDEWRGAYDPIIIYIALDANGGIVNNDIKYYDFSPLMSLLALSNPWVKGAVEGSTLIDYNLKCLRLKKIMFLGITWNESMKLSSGILKRKRYMQIEKSVLTANVFEVVL